MKVWMQIYLMVIWTSSVSADWTLGTVFNTSDLVIEQAWHYDKSGKPRTLSSLTKLFHDSLQHKRTSVTVKYHIKSHGLALRGRDRDGYEVDIFLDGQPAHSVEWNRKKTRKITNFTQGCSVADGAFCARVVVKDVALPVAMAYDAPTTFNMTIAGSSGSYKVTLQEVKFLQKLV